MYGKAAHLVKEGEALEPTDASLADVDYFKVAVQCSREVQWLIACVEDAHVCAQGFSMDAHGQHHLEGMRPVQLSQLSMAN